MIPNLLSFFRILSVVPIITLFYFQFYYAAAGLFLIAALTDFFDGLIARKFDQETDFGSLLDLMADKILVSSMLIWFIFTFDNLLIFISAYLIILRELIISSLRVHFLSKAKSLELIKPNFLGKLKTTIQLIAIALILIAPVFNNTYLVFAAIVLFLSALLSLISLQNYYSSWNEDKN
jgi:CDP-diacylglycerol--glycerol-3-phosphate 3-phosphatidyltransferase